MRDTRDPETLGLQILAIRSSTALSILQAADGVAGNPQMASQPLGACAATLESPPQVPSQNGAQPVTAASCLCTPDSVNGNCVWHGF